MGAPLKTEINSLPVTELGVTDNWIIPKEESTVTSDRNTKQESIKEEMEWECAIGHVWRVCLMDPDLNQILPLLRYMNLELPHAFSVPFLRHNYRKQVKRGLGNPLTRKGKIHHNLFFEMILILMEESTMTVKSRHKCLLQAQLDCHSHPT